VRLLDRSAQGIEPTIYGDALLKCSVAVFDELKQGIRDIEFPVRCDHRRSAIGSMEAPWFTVLPDAFRRFSQQYPRIQVYTDLIDHSEAFLALRERRYDCVLIAIQMGLQDKAADDLTMEILCEVIVVACALSKWARRRNIDLAELIEEPWVVRGARAWGRPMAEEIFAASGLSYPNPRIATNSIILRARLIAGRPYLGMFLTSVLRRLVADN